MTSPARVAADVAAALPFDDPLGRLARQRLDVAARHQEHTMRKLTEPFPDPEPADPRAVRPTQIGSQLRDAAVDPQPRDFMAPVNAGRANPHGRDVFSGGVA